MVMPFIPSCTFIADCRNLKIGYFSQHHVEQLDLNISAVELLSRKFPGVLGLGVQEKVPGLLPTVRPPWGGAEQPNKV